MSVLFNENNWFVCPRVKPEAETRLFMFPYAGGGPAVFNKWSLEFPGNIETWLAHYPGRGSRHQEAPIREIEILAGRFVQAIQHLLDKPFSFFGHSLGGLIAFEFARQLQQQDLSQPQILFLSACGAPHLPDPNLPIHKLPDSEFIDALQRLNGIPSEIANQPDVMKLLLPILRADFEAVESYQYDIDASPLHVPILAFAGVNDPRVSPARVEGWARHTDAGFKLRSFPGDHFFINTCGEAVIASIAAELKSHEKN
jgi:medium-chain acyl-[acyl-carrier-protein] hydrolase